MLNIGQTAPDRYRKIRLRSASPSDYLFVLASGGPIGPVYLNRTLIRLKRQLGLRD